MSNSRLQQLNMVADVDHWTFTTVNQIVCRHMWVVENPAGLESELTSPLFAANQNEHNVKWELHLYWINTKLRLRLYLVSADDKSVYYKYNVSILGNSEGKLSSVFSSPQCSGSAPDHTEYVDFSFTKPQIREVNNEWLRDNMLTIVVDITILNCIQQETGIVTRETANCTANEDLGKLLNDPEFSDVTIIVGDSKLRAHKSILALRSDVFAAMFRHNLEEKKTNQIIIDDFDFSIIREMLCYIYTGQTSEISQMAEGLLPAADKYAVEGLKKACVRELNSNLTIETVVNALISADLHSLDDLKQRAIDFIVAHSGDIIKTDAFRKMVKTHPNIALDIIEKQHFPTRPS